MTVLLPISICVAVCCRARCVSTADRISDMYRHWMESDLKIARAVKTLNYEREMILSILTDYSLNATLFMIPNGIGDPVRPHHRGLQEDRVVQHNSQRHREQEGAGQSDLLPADGVPGACGLEPPKQRILGRQVVHVPDRRQDHRLRGRESVHGKDRGLERRPTSGGRRTGNGFLFESLDQV
ncbi:hypothetical protein EJ02DRAFT_457135 [Clathrospora elynae]|uniref:Uncharacterized protein n=1 Tax=Clathrospora elynae TaxID=706981 RepID=A0A6A5SHE3_9PLEO|nr:hypothetical protein EJ02DRAFT_457135 [Clathrospora elynae]